MTNLQKEIIKVLLTGGSIAGYGNTYRLRDAKKNPVKKFAFKTFNSLKFLLRKRGGYFLLTKGKCANCTEKRG